MCATSPIANSATTNHYCLSVVCEGDDCCPFAFVPLDACPVFLQHGMCAARHCGCGHYVLALRAETMAMYVFRVALSVGQANAISPSVVLMTTDARLALLKIVREAVEARVDDALQSGVRATEKKKRWRSPTRPQTRACRAFLQHTATALSSTKKRTSCSNSM